MGNVYAVLFSNGLTKVGQSKDPAKRIAQHADRLSVAGIAVAESHVAACDDPDAAERALIILCRAAANSSRKNEWFEGLVFADVRGWVDQCSQIVRKSKGAAGPAFRPHFPAGWGDVSFYHFCRACSVAQPTPESRCGYLCNQCVDAGYTAVRSRNALALRLNGVDVPMWSASDQQRPQYPSVASEEMRPDCPWARVEDREWPLVQAHVWRYACGPTRAEIGKALDISRPTAEQHLQALRRAGLVTLRTQWRGIFLRRPR